MVENNLDFDELRRILRPILRLKSMRTIVGELGATLGIELNDEHEAATQTKLRLMYKGFELRIACLQWFDGAGATCQITFLTRRLWWHLGPLDPWRAVVDDLKAICQQELDGVRFIETTTDGHNWLESQTFEIRLIHDARACRFPWKEISDSSPLWIWPQKVGRAWGVTFFFNAGGYQRSQEKISLRSDWEAHSCDLSTFLRDYGRKHAHQAEAVLERIERVRDGRYLDDLE